MFFDPNKSMKQLPKRCETFTPQDFKDAVVGLSLNPKVLTRCPDQWVGDVECKYQGFEYLDKGKQGFEKRLSLNDSSISLPLKRMILVLESPHIDEFNSCHDSQEPKAYGPANGTTGLSIRNYISAPTRDFLTLSFVHPQDVFALILMNSVPYQCSLGNKLSGRTNTGSRKDRDKVFMACWGKAKQDFCNRLTRYLTEETLIINACTRGEHMVRSGYQSRRELVDEAIVECGVRSERHLRRYHPSALRYWRSGSTW